MFPARGDNRRDRRLVRGGQQQEETETEQEPSHELPGGHLIEAEPFGDQIPHRGGNADNRGRSSDKEHGL